MTYNHSFHALQGSSSTLQEQRWWLYGLCALIAGLILLWHLRLQTRTKARELERQRLLNERLQRIDQLQRMNTLLTLEQSVDALQESELRYRTLFESVPVGIGLSTPGGRFLAYNDTMLEMIGYSKADIESVNAIDIYQDPQDRARLVERLQKDGHVQDYEITLKRQDGTFFDANMTVTPITLSGELVFLTVAADITARKRAESERDQLLTQIQQQARQMQQIIDTVPEGVLLLDIQKRVALANPFGEKILADLANVQVGDTLSHLSHRPLATLLTSPPQGLWHEVIADQRNFQIIARPINNTIETVPTTSGWVLVIRDITQQRKIEQQVQQQERLAAVGQLAAGIAHDFNNIMATIVLYAQMTSRSEQVPARVRERMQTITQQTQHATNLIRQILDFSRSTTLERQPLDLVPLLKEQIKILERILPENIQIGLGYGHADYTINADPTRIQQIIMNLAVNARDAMPDGGSFKIELERITVRQDTPPALAEMGFDDWVELAVSDTGTGIAPDIVPHIFEPFFTTKEPGKGSGLGLSQVYGIVMQHDGYIDVQTEPGQGTAFMIYLPALSTDSDESVPWDSLQLVEGKGETLLLVEDNQATRHAMSESLTSLNYQVLAATSGEQALDILERHRDEVKLILSDVVMPGLSGITLLQTLRERGIETGVVLLTGHPMEEELEALRVEGLTDWLLKPPSLELLAETVARALRQHATSQ